MDTALEIVFGIVGGLGLFLYGMRNMADGLQKAAGKRLRRLLEVLTTNRLTGVLVGTLVTALIQSSSTTTVMVVGFVNARLMTLSQAVGVIMGANIGTTVTAQLIAFRLEKYALPALGLGVILVMFGRSQRFRYLGQIIMGFGMLFLGLELMSNALRPLREVQAFRDLLVSMSNNPILGVVAGTALTVIIQSSSASIGILQSLAGEGLIDIKAALPVLFGDNIGTTITAVLSSIGASITAKRAAAIHVVFNLIGTTIFVIALPIVLPIVVATSSDILRQIANAHTIFNLSNTLIQLPFAGLIVWLVVRLVPGKEEEEEMLGPRHLDERFLETPSVAIGSVRKDLAIMADLARDIVQSSVDELLEEKNKSLDAIFRKEAAVNRFNTAITEYLSKLGRKTLGAEHAQIIRQLHNVLADIERVGDHGENIAELTLYSRENNLTYSNTAKEEMRTLADTALKAFSLAFDAWIEDDKEKAQQVFELERQVDALEKEFRSSHINRLNNNQCHPTSGVVFLDLASNLERVADHAANIADLVSQSGN